MAEANKTGAKRNGWQSEKSAKGRRAGKKTSSLKDRKSNVIHGKKIGWFGKPSGKIVSTPESGKRKTGGKDMRSSVER